MSPAVLCGVSSLEVWSYSVPDGCFEVHVALHQSYIIGKFIMLHVRLLNFIFGKLYHVQSIAAYRATVRDVITQYKSLLHGKLSRYECVPYLSHNSLRITECVQCMLQINVLTLCVFISQYRVNVTNQKQVTRSYVNSICN